MTTPTFPTPLNIEVQEEMSNALAGFDRQSRWGSGQSGTVVGQTEVGGMIVQNVMRDSGVRFNGQELPERFPAYKRDGDCSMLPMAQMAYQLGKTDRQGRRVYHLHRWDFPSETPIPTEGRVCAQCTDVKLPIDQTCEVCLERNVRKKFFRLSAYTRHMRAFHPDELEEERDRVRAERERPPSLVTLMSNASPEEKAALRLLLQSPEPTEPSTPRTAARKVNP